MERLTPALPAKAFRGELVVQDPDDEPAVVLLARVRGARGLKILYVASIEIDACQRKYAEAH